MTYTWNCMSCDTEFEVEEGVDGECPNCKRKYEWDFDGDYGLDSVYTVCWHDK